MSLNVVQFCEEVLNCILTVDEIRDAIGDLAKDTVTGITVINITNVLGKGDERLDNCNPDNVFGAMSFLVDYLIQASRDTLELIEASSNLFEIVVEWLEDFGEIAPVITIGLQYLAWLQDTVQENFEAQVTQTLIDEYRCDLFCLYLENCNGITARQLSDYFLGRISGVGLQGSLEQLIDFLTDGSWSGTQLVDAMLAGMVGVMTVDENPITQIQIPTLYSLDTAVKAGANDPDPDWTFLCDPCAGTFCHDINFLEDDGDFTAFAVDAGNAGSWSLGTGWQDGQHRIGSRYYRGVRITNAFTLTEITSISFTVDYVKGLSDTPEIPALAIRNNTGFVASLLLIEHQDAVSGVQTLTWTGLEDIDSIYLLALCSAQDTPTYSGSAIITSMTICGNGSNPFV